MLAIENEFSRIKDQALLSSFIAQDTIQAYLAGLVKHRCWSLLIGHSCSKFLPGTTAADLELIDSRLKHGQLDASI